MARILLIGRNGQLGWELQRMLAPLDEINAVDYPDIDLEHPETVRDLNRQIHPQVIVNAAAYTDVDRAESEPERAWKINALAPGVMADEAFKSNALLIHYSTDYVFDGGKAAPYLETDTPGPLNSYGESKLAGEQAIQSVGGAYLILRTAWVYSLRTDSFVSKVLGWARENETLRVVDDQISNPTWARSLAEVTAQILACGDAYLRERSGLYHLAGGGYASRYKWAQEILKLDSRKREQVVKQLLPVPTSAFPTHARRPLFSALDCGKFKKIFKMQLPDWKQSLALAMQERTASSNE